MVLRNRCEGPVSRIRRHQRCRSCTSVGREERRRRVCPDQTGALRRRQRKQLRRQRPTEERKRTACCVFNGVFGGRKGSAWPDGIVLDCAVEKMRFRGMAYSAFREHQLLFNSISISLLCN